jgi:hypothetical protein
MSDLTIQEINSLELNNDFIQEIKQLSISQAKDAIRCLYDYIDNLRYHNGRKVRVERKEAMKIIIRILYKFALKEDGQCSPSMRTIVHKLNPTLEEIQPGDSLSEIKRKDRDMSSLLMFVHRTVKILRQFGIIKVHQYRADTNRNDDPDNINYKNPNFYYELVPISQFCSAFKVILNTCRKGIRKIGVIIRDVQESITLIETKLNNKLNLHREKIKWEEINSGKCKFGSGRIRPSPGIFE